jgi:predicted AAA+ superfamily ATPase
MGLTNQKQVGKGLLLLKEALAVYVPQELQALYGADWLVVIKNNLTIAATWPVATTKWEVNEWLTVLDTQWEVAFAPVLGTTLHNCVQELARLQARWAKEELFSLDDTYRALDNIGQLLTVIAAPQAGAVAQQKQEMLRRQLEANTRQGSAEPRVSGVVKKWKPWRTVVQPHPDIASGQFQQAEFAADLWQVYLQEGAPEYRDPQEFFRRTFLTTGLRTLLAQGIRRLCGQNGDPVIELQTNFGGGKTHSMLALYHLFSGIKLPSIPNLIPLIADIDEFVAGQLPTVRRVVIVGNKISPGQPQVKPDGTIVRTLWGEIAWQLGGQAAYKLLQAADETATNPGDLLRMLFNQYAPCLILIDEWVAYARQLHDQADLPAGSFETHFTFAQALTEAAKTANQTLLVVSIPATDEAKTAVSEVEVGGQRGRLALNKLKNAIGRVESPWRPATTEENFEIVRQRLFQPLVTAQDTLARDAVIAAFMDCYRTHAAEFPRHCQESDYERRLNLAYPIHPELFDRLTKDWSQLERFQRTRGILRLLAATIHVLMVQEDNSLLIMPGQLPLETIQTELTRYLADDWTAVIEQDVDGQAAVSYKIDRENQNLGQYAAAQRVARSIFFAAAATFHLPLRGLTEPDIKLGCAQPGEGTAIFGDALRRLTEHSSFLYADRSRYWYSIQTNVTKLAEERAAKIAEEDVIAEIQQRILEETKLRQNGMRVHAAFPTVHKDLDDVTQTRLVILDCEHPYVSKALINPALQLAQECVEKRGNAPRSFRNSVVFLAAEQARLAELMQGVRQYLAWQSIQADREILKLEPIQHQQAAQRLESADTTVKLRIPETYIWLLCPYQSEPTGAIEWQEHRLTGQDSIVVRAIKKLRNDDNLITQLSPRRLRMEIDRIPLWRGNQVRIKQLIEDFAKYIYLPRLLDTNVLLLAIEESVALVDWAANSFAYAASWNGTHYQGLRAGERGSLSKEGWVVKPDVAIAYWPTPVATKLPTEVVKKEILPSQFYGSLAVDPTNWAPDIQRAVTEVIQHLAALPNVKLELQLEVRATIAQEVPEHIHRTVTENCRTLHFKDYKFYQLNKLPDSTDNEDERSSSE